jgi:RimJ/RimL family protein N-acetyltransferase
VSRIEPKEYPSKTDEVVLVRSAVAADAAALVALRGAVAEERLYTLAEPDERNLTDETERRSIAEHADEPGQLYLVAQVRQAVVGLLTFENGSLRRTAHSGMFAIYVQQEWRERGVGSALMERLLEWATAHPLIEKVTLAVFSTNSRAIAAYTKLGFAVEGHCPRDMKIGPGEYIDSVLMYRFVKEPR